MPEIVYLAADGRRTSVRADVGDSVMQTAIRNGVEGIVGECGGFLSCATCHVYVAEAYRSEMPPASEAEDELLDGTADERFDSSRLSCQIMVAEALDGLLITMPASQL